MRSFEIVRKSIQIGSIDLYLADISCDIQIELLPDFYQLVL